MIKLIALDLDDTLLDSKFKVSPDNAQAIAAAMTKGVTVTLATGRMYCSALPFALELGLNVPLITYHGALVKTALSKEVLYARRIPRELALDVIKVAEESGFNLNLYLEDRLYAKEGNPHIADYSKLAQVECTLVPDLAGAVFTDPDKIMVIDEEPKLDALTKVLKDIVGDRLHITKSKPFFLEITHPEATKGRALDTLVQQLGIDRSEVMAVGDSYNDLDMLEYAGVAVAMGNARSEVKAKADFVTLANDEHGVAEAINRFVLRAGV